MINQKFFRICCLIFTALVISAAAVLISRFYVKKPSDTDVRGVAADSGNFTSAVPDEAETTYFLTAGDGILCIYSCNENSQILTDAITYIDLYSLDSSTKQSLESGIKFQNRLEVIRFIEEIGS